MEMDFSSDNATGVAPEIMAALARANAGTAPAYGADGVTEAARAALRRVFEHAELEIFPLATGTAANALALAAVTPSHGLIYCHREAHIETDECGAPEFYTGGAKLALLDGADAKFEAATLARALATAGFGVERRAQPAAVSISQASEAGAVYRAEEITAIAAVARANGLALHMDGARFANALVRLDLAPGDITWRAGVDVLSLGATKNGAMAAEAVIVFDPARARDLPYRRRKGGHTVSKMRYVSAQLLAYVSDDLWLRNARHANAMAARLAAGLAALPGASLAHPVEANEVFVRLPEAAIRGLEAAGVGFHRWGGPEATTIRLVTAFDSASEAVERVIALARGGVEAPASKA